jgi:hypothetical protein
MVLNFEEAGLQFASRGAAFLEHVQLLVKEERELSGGIRGENPGNGGNAVF